MSSQSTGNDALQKSMLNAQKRLAKRVPNLQVQYNPVVRVPEIVGTAGGSALAEAVPGASNEETLRGFLAENSALYGLTTQQVGQLRKVSDYTNPAGNLSFVEFQQEVNGISVFQGYVRGILSADGRLVRTTGLLAPGVSGEALSTVPTRDAAEAVVSAAATIHVPVEPGTVYVLDRAADGRTMTVARGPFDEDTKVETIYFPLAPGQLILAYQMVLWEPVNAYMIIVDANTGELLWRKNITQDQTQPVTYNIYNNDSPTPLSPSNCTAPSPCSLPPGITRTDVTEVSENAAADNLGWIPDGAGNAVTTGNNVDAGLDVVAPNGIDPTGRATATGRTFSFPYIPDGASDPTGSNSPTDTNYRMGIVTNIFFWANRYHDLIYNFGFTEAAGNFQDNNFSRGGLGNDHVRAEAQDSSGTNNANFSTPPDGQLPRMQMFIFTTTPVNRDGDLDTDVFVHEMTHGTSNRLHANATGLGSTESAGMGEGWSDYYARALRSDASEDVDGIYAAGGYVTKNYYYGIRRFPYAVKSNVGPNGKPHNPLTFADIDPTEINLSDGAFPPAFNAAANEVHDIGEVWCMTLLEMRAQLIHTLGFAAGNPKAIQIVTDGMKLDPVNPTMIDSRNSILAANCSGFAGANELDIWKGFSIRGMGFRAGYAVGADGASHVLENFDGPNLTLGTVTASEVTGNGNGQFDPGETISLSIPLTNTLCATSATNASATLSPGGGSANYGTIAPGGNGTQVVNFTVPTSAACGSAIPIDITVNSTEFGPTHYTFTLPIGQRAALSSFENFDGVTAPALPGGWTTTHSGAGLGWVTSTTNPDTAPNSAFTGDQPNEGTDSLISPIIPVNTALGQLSFRNEYNLENGFDAETLQIKVGNGAFQDIIAAGGSFVSGGYNSNIGWTGLSGGTSAAPTYITTVVNLPASANGQFIQLRWTVHSDANTTASGVAGANIDTIQLASSALACSTFGASTVNISGRVTDGASNPLVGFQVTLSGTTNVSTLTDGSGNYSFTGLVSGGSYTVTPTTPGFNYTPPSRAFNNLTTDVTNADFVGAPAPGISGRVTSAIGGAGIDGVTITLSGSSSGTTNTSGGGFYSFSPLAAGGNYTVTPSGGNNTYSPASLTFNNLNTAVTNANFVATEAITCNPVGSTVTGSIAAGDTTQANRLTRTGSPSTCSGKAFPGETAVATIRYDQYTFTNTSGSAACISVTIAADFAVHSEAYLNSYDPANKGTNFLGDLGVAYGANNQPASYSFNVPAGATYVVVVNETALNAGGNYTLSVCNTTPPPPAPPAQRGQVLITEFRQSVGSTTSSNEYVELYNNTDAPIDIGGYGLAVFNASFGGDVVLGFPASPLIILRRGHLLIANVAAGGYSLSAYAAPDLSHANANLMPDNQGFGLIDASRSVLIDSVGFTGNGGSLPYIEGQGLQPTTGARPNVEHAWVRKIGLKTNLPQDTDNNAADFQLVSVTGTTFNASPTPIQSMLGAPGPENTASPVVRNGLNTLTLLDPGAGSASAPNRSRDLTADPANNSTFGTLSIRRTVTNSSGAAVTRLRFRIVTLTTFAGTPPAGTADLRARTSAPPATVAITGPNAACPGNICPMTATTLETPPAQASGGGLNSSLSVGTITLGAPLQNGQSVNVEFLLGVQQSGHFEFFVNIESLP
ncbi:MAG TPA: M36 family metallopeptidase [Pyrinomonadaceae bacterium]|nr:M36 family metallopeptidase [Pyrinomonadaceae bacterium]